MDRFSSNKVSRLSGGNHIYSEVFCFNSFVYINKDYSIQPHTGMYIGRVHSTTWVVPRVCILHSLTAIPRG